MIYCYCGKLRLVSSPGNGIIEFVFFFFQSFYCLGCSFFSQCFYMNPMASKTMMKTRKRRLKLMLRRSQRKTALLCVPKIVETMPIHARVDVSTFALQMALLTEVSVPMGYIGTMRKSKFINEFASMVMSLQWKCILLTGQTDAFVRIDYRLHT